MTYEDLWETTFIKNEEEDFNRLSQVLSKSPESALSKRLLKDAGIRLRDKLKFSGKDIQEPVPSICKDILTSPEKYEDIESEDYLKRYAGYYGIKDKDTGVLFIVGFKSGYSKPEIMDMDFFSEDEVIILSTAITYTQQKHVILENNLGRMELCKVYPNV